MLGSGGTFLPFVKNGGILDSNFGKRISGNIFDHKEDTLGIILSAISGLLDDGPSVSVLQGFEWRHAGFRSAYFGRLSKMKAF